MKKAFLLLSTFCLLLGFAGVAGAIVLDFEGLTSQMAVVVPGGYSGFTWDSSWYLYSDNYYATPAHSGDYAIINANLMQPVSIRSSNPFTFNGVWMTSWYGYGPMNVKVQGFDQSNNLIAETPYYSISNSNYQYLSANFENVYKLSFLSLEQNYDYYAYVMDDFAFNEPINGTNPVPEPATMMLLGSGLLGIIGLRKKAVK